MPAAGLYLWVKLYLRLIRTGMTTTSTRMASFAIRVKLIGSNCQYRTEH